MSLDMRVLLEEGKKGCLSEKTVEAVRTEILDAMSGIKRKGINKLMKYMQGSDFFTAPASTKFHGNYEGGLASHSYLVYREFDELLSRHGSDLPSESRIISGICHDFCKIGVYRKTEAKKGKAPVKPSEQSEGRFRTPVRKPYQFDDEYPLGHGEKSLLIISKYIEPTIKESLLIRWHTGGYDQNYEINSEKVKQMCPEMVFLQSADRIASSWYDL